MKKIIFTSLLLLFSCNVFAQMQKVDSLVNVLETQKLTADEQLELYYKIYLIYVLYDIVEASEYARKGLIIAEKKSNKTMASKFHAGLGRIYNTKSSYDTALVHWEKALGLAIAAKDKDQEVSIYIGIGILYGQQEKDVLALEYFLKALSISESIGDERGSMILMSNIASMYRVKDNNERAIYYLEKAKNIADDIDDASGKTQIYFELGAIYYTLGIEKSDAALEYALKAYKISQELNDVTYQGATTQLLSALYYNYVKDYDMALKYASESLQLAERIGDPRMVHGAWITTSNVYRVQKRYKESEAAALKALEIDSTNTNMGMNLMENIVLANIFIGDKNRTSSFFHKYIDIVRKHTNQSNRELIADMDFKYETEKKEMRIAALEEEKKLYRWLGAAGVAILLLAFGLLFFRHRVNVQKIKQMEQEKQLIATQAVLDGEAAERSRLARDLHDGLGGMLSVVKLNLKDVKHYAVIDGFDVESYAKAVDMLDQSIGELRRVAHHIMPESLMRYGLKVSLEDFCRAIPGAHFQYLGENPRLDSRLEVLIYRCAYELVNNAVKHAKATDIKLQLMVDSGLVSLAVHDNGVGFDTHTVKLGMGLDNIRTRIAMYNGKMTIHSAPDQGTEISIEIEQQISK